MASDLEKEMQIEQESSVDTRELLPRDGPLTYGRQGSIVALVAEDEPPETQENVDEVAREHFTF